MHSSRAGQLLLCMARLRNIFYYAQLACGTASTMHSSLAGQLLLCIARLRDSVYYA